MKKTKNIIWIIALILVIILIGAIAFGYYKNATNEVKNPVATMEVEGFGTVKIELYPDKAPQTVSNFITLANRGFYDGLTFHRIVKDFMIQGGDKQGTGSGSATLADLKDDGSDTEYSIKGEFKSNGVNNELKHTEGVLSMARTMIKDSASSQFFIMHKPAPHLDGEYAAFGKITEGLDIVDQIANVPTNFQDCPTTPVVIKTIRRA